MEHGAGAWGRTLGKAPDELLAVLGQHDEVGVGPGDVVAEDALASVLELLGPGGTEEVELDLDGPADSVLCRVEGALERVALGGDLVALEVLQGVPQTLVVQRDVPSHLHGTNTTQGWGRGRTGRRSFSRHGWEKLDKGGGGSKRGGGIGPSRGRCPTESYSPGCLWTIAQRANEVVGDVSGAPQALERGGGGGGLLTMMVRAILPVVTRVTLFPCFGGPRLFPFCFCEGAGESGG